MSDCDKNEVYPSKLAKMSEFRHIFSRATLWVDIATNKKHLYIVTYSNKIHDKLFEQYLLNNNND